MKITITKDGTTTTYELTVEEYKVLFGASADKPAGVLVDPQALERALKDLPYWPAGKGIKGSENGEGIELRGCRFCYACNGQPWMAVVPPTCTCNPICKVIPDNKITCNVP